VFYPLTPTVADFRGEGNRKAGAVFGPVQDPT